MPQLYFPTRLDIRNRVRFFIDEPVQAYYQNSDINYAINNVQQTVAIEIDQVDEQYFVNVTTPTTITFDGVSQYFTLAPDFWKMTRMQDGTTGLPIPFTVITDQNQFFQQLPPPLVSINSMGFSAFIVGNSVGFTPIPTVQGNTAIYYYVPILPDLTLDTDVSQIPRPFIDLLAIQAAIDCLIKDEDDTSQLERKQVVLMNQLTRTARQRQQQNPKKVQRVGDSSTYPGWSI